MIKLIVVGAGWHGGEVRAYLQDLASSGVYVHLLGFVDDVRPRGPWLGTEILGSFDDFLSEMGANGGGVRYITATGNNDLRQKFVRRVERAPVLELAPWTLIHPRSSIGPEVQIGGGSCIAPGTVLTTHINMGRHCILNVNATVSHDCEIGDYTNINPGATVCGNVRIGRGAYIGAGATIIDKVAIGEGAIIGAGAVVIRDIPAYSTAVGVPARVIKSHLSGDAENE